MDDFLRFSLKDLIFALISFPFCLIVDLTQHFSKANKSYKQQIKKLSSDNLLSVKEFLVPKKKSVAPGSIVVGYASNKKQRIELPQEKVLEHVLIVGTNGHGQMRDFVYPNLLNINNSFLIIDRDFLYYPTLPMPKNHKLIIFDYENPLTATFNWIPLCQDIDWACSLAEASLINNVEELKSFHTQQTLRFLVAIYCHTATLDNPTPVESYKLISNYGATELLEILLNSSSHEVKGIANALQAFDPKVLEHYLEKIKGALGWLKEPKIISFTNSSLTPDFTKLRTEKIGIYLEK